MNFNFYLVYRGVGLFVLLFVCASVWLAVFCGVPWDRESDRESDRERERKKSVLCYITLLSLQGHSNRWAHIALDKIIPVQCGIQILNEGKGEHWYMTGNQYKQTLWAEESEFGETKSDLCMPPYGPHPT